DHDAPPLRQLSRHDYDRAVAGAEDLAERRVGPILRLEVKMRLPAEDDDVPPLRLAQDVLRGIPDVLEHGGGYARRGTARPELVEKAQHASMGIREQRLVPVLLVRVGAHGHQLCPIDRRLVQHAETDQADVEPRGPVERQRGCAHAPRGAVERDQDRPQHAQRPSRARFSARTFTRGSPRNPSCRPSVCWATSWRTTDSSSFLAFATRPTW